MMWQSGWKKASLEGPETAESKDIYVTIRIEQQYHRCVQNSHSSWHHTRTRSNEEHRLKKNYMLGTEGCRL